MKKSNMPSAAAIDIISGTVDILSEILLRIPPKPLLRFKSVSKQWLYLISDPHFARKHTSRHSNAPVSGILYRRTPALKSDSDTNYDYIPLDDNDSSSSTLLKSPKIFKGVNVLQSCNGLLLCCNSNKSDYYVCNLTTNGLFTLPRLINETNGNSTILGVTLAFDPRESTHYKVVSLRNISKDYPFSSSLCQIDVYSSESKQWRECVCDDPFIPPDHMIFKDGVFSNGVVHWISSSSSLLVYFNVGQEQLVQTSLLSNPLGKKRFRYVGESCNHLHLLDVAGAKTTRFPAFELDLASLKWQHKYMVDLDQVVAACPEMVKPYMNESGDFYYAFVVLMIVREEGGDGEDESSLLMHIPGKIVSYKLKNGSFRVVRDLTVDRSDSKATALQWYGCLDAYQYIETLACVC